MQQITDQKVRLDDDEVTALAAACSVAVKADRAFRLFTGGNGLLTDEEVVALRRFAANVSVVTRVTVQTAYPVDVRYA